MRTVILALVITSAVVLAQSPPSGNDLRFEVASIKPNVSNALGSNGSSEHPDGGLTLLNVPMMTLVARAQFPVIAPIDMVGLPEWARSDRYDVRVKSPLSRPATPQERAAMVRAMLADRVKIQFDRAFASGGPNLTPSPDDLPDLFSALPAQLGLKLESSKAERDVLVIDRLERPTEN